MNDARAPKTRELMQAILGLLRDKRELCFVVLATRRPFADSIPHLIQ